MKICRTCDDEWDSDYRYCPMCAEELMTQREYSDMLRDEWDDLSMRNARLDEHEYMVKAAHDACGIRSVS